MLTLTFASFCPPCRTDNPSVSSFTLSTPCLRHLELTAGFPASTTPSSLSASEIPVQRSHVVWQLLRSRYQGALSTSPRYASFIQTARCVNPPSANHVIPPRSDTHLPSSSSADQFDVNLETQLVKIYPGDKELPSFDLITEKIGKTGKTVRPEGFLSIIHPIVHPCYRGSHILYLAGCLSFTSWRQINSKEEF